MIQRIQTVYMFLAAVVTVVCLCLQIGTFDALDVPVLSEYNLWLTDSIVGAHHFMVWPLFDVLVLSATVGLCTIFLYTNRKLQARVCGWYILFGVFSQTVTGNLPDEVSLTFRPAVPAALPCVALILYLMARRSILADEKLVRAADRIR